jgi:hypothetical protein
MEFIVYRFRNELRELIYVGSTNGLGARLYAHARDKDWWPEVVHIEIERCGSNETMLETERLVIETEHPKYNKQFNGKHDAKQWQPQQHLSRTSKRQRFINLVLAGEAVTPNKLARESGYHARTMHRLLGALTVSGSMVRVDYGRYVITDSNIQADDLMSVLNQVV